MQTNAPGQVSMETSLLSARGRDVQLTSGLKVWSNTAAPNSTWAITGSEFSQLLEVNIAPGEVVTAEPGTMAYMTPELEPDIDIGSCDQACKRCCCANESFFRLHFRNESDEVQQVGLTPTYPAKIVPVDLSKYDGMIFNRGAFLAALGTNWSVDIKRVSSAGAFCCGGQGLFMNTLHGSGMVFLNAGGTVMTKVLADLEELVVEQNNVLAFERTVQLGVRRSGGLMVCCCSGMGMFQATLTGPGFVMLHTMGLAKLRASLAVASNNNGGNNNSKTDS